VSDGQVARVYASALFAAATEAASVSRTGDDLRAFAAALQGSPALDSAVFNPQIEPEAKLRVVTALTHDADRLAAGALSLLLEKSRLGALNQVVVEFDRLAAQAAGVIDVELTTAVPVTGDVERHIVRRVEDTTGRTARLSKRVDAAIIGGLVLRVGDVIIDGSLRSRIRQLHDRLKYAEVRGGDQ